MDLSSFVVVYYMGMAANRGSHDEVANCVIGYL